ncbi:small glutamine-rich tetratricopeptide repeat-containing protein alpha isoform X2 [Syngnathus typhle]|uniref:small glutamine-rich tetratricopeptide repeat-containing protein alpha isoform X2 n=1 Tax=Syngnathus typhle TaxID=161592 RepID=UPI002A6ABDD0|nr:small glutamine-rich tetratricopeptide repeat-containing protein alpha isoform X2 [Syngnathus typhle]
MTDSKRLAFSIIRYLHEQLQSGNLSSGAQESLEVAVQCLETAFEVSADDRSLDVPLALPEIFASATRQTSSRENNNDTTIGEGQRGEAERLKADGNDQMKVDNYAAAVEFYSKAIALNPHSAVYYCNRLALASLNKHSEAVTFYKKALELDPDNDTYKSNLKIAEEKMGATSPANIAEMGGVDLAGLLSNPGFMNMASSLMTNPQVQQMMSGMMPGAYGAGGGAAGGGGGIPGGAPGPAPVGDLSGLIQAGLQFAHQMQQQNPELIEQLRSQIRNRTPSAGNEEQP